VITEQLCIDELGRRADEVPTAADKPLDVSTAIAVGSITAAALAGSEAVRRVAEVVSREVGISRAQLEYAADVLGVEPPADPDVPVERWHAELVDSARLEAFARWLNAAQHERVQLVHGLEHPGDSNQPDNLHRH
jgi:[acyl-carrier-protein] S-malonyltransferase